MQNLNIELKTILDKVITWSENFNNGHKDFDFDIDNELFYLGNKFKMDFKGGEFLLIYNLLDFYCDAIKHGFKTIDENYSVLEAASDIKKIIEIIELNKNLKLPEDLKNRLIKI